MAQTPGRARAAEDLHAVALELYNEVLSKSTGHEQAMEAIAQDLVVNPDWASRALRSLLKMKPNLQSRPSIDPPAMASLELLHQCLSWISRNDATDLALVLNAALAMHVQYKRNRVFAEAKAGGMRGAKRHDLYFATTVDDSAVQQALNDVFEALVLMVESTGIPDGFTAMHIFFTGNYASSQRGNFVAPGVPKLPFESRAEESFDLTPSFETLLARTQRSSLALVCWAGYELAHAVLRSSRSLTLAVVRVLARQLGSSSALLNAPNRKDDLALLSEALFALDPGDYEAACEEITSEPESLLVYAASQAVEAGHDDSHVVDRMFGCMSEKRWGEFLLVLTNPATVELVLAAATLVAPHSATSANSLCSLALKTSGIRPDLVRHCARLALLVGLDETCVHRKRLTLDPWARLVRATPSVALVTACLGDDEANDEGSQVLFTMLTRTSSPKQVCRRVAESACALFLAPWAWAHGLDDVDVDKVIPEPHAALFFKHASATRALRSLIAGVERNMRLQGTADGEDQSPKRIDLVEALTLLADLFSLLDELAKRKDAGMSSSHLKKAARVFVLLGAISCARVLLNQAATVLLEGGSLWEGGNALVMVSDLQLLKHRNGKDHPSVGQLPPLERAARAYALVGAKDELAICLEACRQFGVALEFIPSVESREKRSHYLLVGAFGTGNADLTVIRKVCESGVNGVAEAVMQLKAITGRDLVAGELDWIEDAPGFYRPRFAPSEAAAASSGFWVRRVWPVQGGAGSAFGMQERPGIDLVCAEGEGLDPITSAVAVRAVQGQNRPLDVPAWDALTIPMPPPTAPPPPVTSPPIASSASPPFVAPPPAPGRNANPVQPQPVASAPTALPAPPLPPSSPPPLPPPSPPPSKPTALPLAQTQASPSAPTTRSGQGTVILQGGPSIKAASAVPPPPPPRQQQPSPPATPAPPPRPPPPAISKPPPSPPAPSASYAPQSQAPLVHLSQRPAAANAQAEAGNDSYGNASHRAQGGQPRREPRKLVLVGPEEMEAAVRRTVLLNPAPGPSTRSGKTLLLQTDSPTPAAQAQAPQGRLGYNVGGVYVSAGDAARVNHFLAAGQAEFPASKPDEGYDVAVRIFANGERLEVVNEPIGDVWFEVLCADCSLEAVSPTQVILTTPTVGSVRLNCPTAVLLQATFGAFQSRRRS